MLGFALLLFGLAASVRADISNGIHVNGLGSVEVVPDMGYVTLHVRREGTSAAMLKKDLDSVVQKVIALTDKLGIDATDVTAAAVSVNPRYRRRDNESVVEGLIATRTVSITLRELDEFGPLLNESITLGVNNVDPIRLDTSRRAALEDQALTLAMEDAQQEAARIAAGFGVELGPVSNVQVGFHSPRPEMRAAGLMADSSGSDFSPGLIRIERSLQATFAILIGK